MSLEAVDRNVLFGVLAWQLGVVERETLMTAMYTWMTDKSQSLPDVLAVAGNLSADDRRWVDEAVERQLKKHDRDPAKTLANLSSIEDVCRELRNIADGDRTAATIAASDQIDPLAKTIAPHGTVHEGGNHGDFEVAPPPRSERFRIVRPLARGGLGEVFVAVDEELKREVALKQILARQADSKTSRARFLLEAEVTGCLEHPGVVPVYGLGTQQDGRPYYAMRFIRGESLEDGIRRFHEADRDPLRDGGQRTVELRNLLTRFVAVCNTIEYAHSRGIVHRDLKPENIMLGPYGETLVVDWGLGRQMEQQAGDLDASAETGETAGPATPSVERPTMMGSVVGTPQFMSPEQASGRLDLIRGPSDVYSLGATMYALLTDQPPFVSSDVRKVLRDVQAGNFPAPRQIRRDIPRGLEAICLKAMELRPEDRYSSARNLADDIEHWLADEPVAALSETPIERAQRWMRRHKTLARAAAAALIVIAGVAWFAYAREAVLRNDLQLALTQEEKAKRDADEARKLAVSNAELAEQERVRAEAHAHRAEEQSSLALATLKSVLFDIQAKLKNVPAAHTVRLSMLTTVIDGLKQVARSLETAADTDHSLVRAHLDLGDIFLQVGGSESAGATAEAQRQFERGVEVASKLNVGNPRNVPARVELAAAYQRMGDVSMQRGNLTACTDWLRKSLELRQKLVDESTDDAKQRDLAASLQRLGMVHQQVGDLVAAQDFYSKFFDLSQQIAKRDPKNVEDRRNLSVSYERMGDISLLQGNDRAAEGFFQKSLEVRRVLAQEMNHNPVANRDLSVTLDRLGDLAQKRGDGDAAGKLFEESLQLRKKLFDDDPHNTQAQRDLLVSYALLGDVALGKQEAEKSADYYRQYHELAQKLSAGDPDNIQLQRDLATSYDRLGYVMSQSGKREEARGFYRKNYELVKKLSDADPSNQPIRQDLATACATLGDLSLQLNDFAAARTYLAEFLAVTRLRIKEHAEDRAARRDLIDALLRNGDLHLRLRELPTAAAELREAFDGAQRASTAEPNDIGGRMYLANALSMLAQYDVQNRDPESATKHLKNGIAEMRRAVEKADAVLQSQVGAWIKEQEALAARCATATKVAADPDAADKQDAGVVAELLDFAAAARIREGKFDAAKNILERLAQLEPATGEKRFLAARRYAAAADGFKADDPQRTELADAAMKLLVEAHKLKALDDVVAAAQLEFAVDFAAIRERKDFQALLEQTRGKK